jgi:hypothetical protein
MIWMNLIQSEQFFAKVKHLLDNWWFFILAHLFGGLFLILIIRVKFVSKLRSKLMLSFNTQVSWHVLLRGLLCLWSVLSFGGIRCGNYGRSIEALFSSLLLLLLICLLFPVFLHMCKNILVKKFDIFQKKLISFIKNSGRRCISEFFAELQRRPELCKFILHSSDFLDGLIWKSS